MNGYLRQSTASQVRTIGPFIDDADFKTLKNALTIANTDILIKKNGAASAAKNSGGATADGSGGLYHLTWDATDSATVGELYGSVKVAGALVVFFAYVVLEEAVYDALYAATAPGYVVDQPVNVTKWLGTAAATPTVGGVPEVDLTHWLGTAAATPNTAGVPKVDVARINNFVAAAEALGEAYGWNGTFVTGTLSTTQATTDIIGEADDAFVGWVLMTKSGAQYPFSAIVTDYDGTTGLLTWAPAFPGAPVNNDLFFLQRGMTGHAVGNRTGALSGAVASVTAGVTLADDAITAAKFDESTAFPLKSADTGLTAVGRVNRLSTLVTKTASVVTDGGNSATQIKTDLTETADDHFKDCLVKITSGVLAEQVKKVTGYNGTTKILSFTNGFTGTPADSVTLEIVNE